MAKKASRKTKESLLTAGAAVFSQKGYRYATIAEICSRAGANIGAVNYHFGSKKRLYRESWRYALTKSLLAHPPDGGVLPGAPAEERLRGMVKALLERMADESNNEFFIVHHELASSTGLLAEVMRTEMRPLHERTQAIVKEILGPQVSEQDARYCEMSIITLCIHPMIMKRADKTIRVDDDEGPPNLDDIEAYTNHVMRFAMAGMEAVRMAAQGRKDGR